MQWATGEPMIATQKGFIRLTPKLQPNEMKWNPTFWSALWSGCQAPTKAVSFHMACLPSLSLSLFLSLHFEAPSLILLFLQFYVCSRKFTCSLGHEWWILCPRFLLFEDHMQKHIGLKFRRWLQISLLIRRDDGWVWHTDTTLFSSSFYKRERMVFIKRGCVWNRLYRAVSFIIIYEFYCTF